MIYDVFQVFNNNRIGFRLTLSAHRRKLTNKSQKPFWILENWMRLTSNRHLKYKRSMIWANLEHVLYFMTHFLIVFWGQKGSHREFEVKWWRLRKMEFFDGFFGDSDFFIFFLMIMHFSVWAAIGAFFFDFLSIFSKFSNRSPLYHNFLHFSRFFIVFPNFSLFHPHFSSLF